MGAGQVLERCHKILAKTGEHVMGTKWACMLGHERLNEGSVSALLLRTLIFIEIKILRLKSLTNHDRLL